MSRIITVIGSRKTPLIYLEKLEDIAKECADSGGWVRSGHAEGADYAAEKGAGKRCIVYMPWRNFNSQLPMLGQPYYEKGDTPDWVLDLVWNIHPNPEALNRTTWLFHCRNMYQILGTTGFQPTSAVYYWAPMSGLNPVGGTRSAVTLARYMGIPTFNVETAHLPTNDLLEEL